MESSSQLDPYALGKILSSVTQTMFGEAFEVDNDFKLPRQNDNPDEYHAYTVSLSGKSNIELLLICSMKCGARLGSHLFQCDTGDVDKNLAGDAVGEILNVVAGQVKSHLSIDHAMGLPKKFTDLATMDLANCGDWKGTVMSSLNSEITMWVAFRQP